MVIRGKEEINKAQKRRLREFKRFLVSLGIIPLKTVQHPFGSTAHYAGGVPHSDKREIKLRTNKSGQLTLDNNIYVADSSTWTGLPAKAPTLTIMANANRVGYEVLKNFKKHQTEHGGNTI